MSDPISCRRDLWVSLCFFFLGIASRLPFRSEWLAHWDSVNFALALEHYDVRFDRPQPPGYFFYVMLGRGVQLLVSDGNAALVWLSMIASALGAVAIYLLGVRMFDRRVGGVAAALALTSPAVWFYGEVALSYALEFALVSLFVLLLYRQVVETPSLWLWKALLLGFIGGVRQNAIVFILPLWIVCLWWSLRWRERILSVLVLMVVTLGWLMPMIALSGGVSGYTSALSGAGAAIAGESSFLVVSELAVNAGRMALYLAYALLLAALPLAWGVWWGVRHWRELIQDRRFWILALWIGPAFGFYLVVHLRQHGHIFTFLPALLLLSAWSIVGLSSKLKRVELRPVALIGLVSVLLLANAIFFLGAPASLFGSPRLPLQTPSWHTILERDQYLESHVSGIRNHFDPATTAIWATGVFFRHPDYYLRDFRQTELSYSIWEGSVLLEEDIDTLVFFDAGAESRIGDLELLYLPLTDGGRLAYAQLPKQCRFVVAEDGVGLRSTE